MGTTLNEPTRTSAEPQLAGSIVALDLLRGLAAISVMLFHIRNASFVEYGALPEQQKTIAIAVLFALSRLGSEAVLVFFVLSGFLVGGRLVHHVQAGTFVAQNYAIDRVTRIFLPLIPACLLTALLARLALKTHVSVFVLLANMTGLNEILTPTLPANGPLWSLSYEIWFYITGGSLAWFFVNRRSITAVCLIALSIAAFSVLNTSFLIYWLFGALTYSLIGTRQAISLFVSGVLLAAVGIASFELNLGSKLFTSTSYIPLEASRGLICIGTSLALPFLCGSGVERRLNAVRWFAGTIAGGSYTLYLVHYPITSALSAVFPKSAVIDWESIAYFLARALLCVLATVVFYFCFERNTKTVRKWLRSVMAQGFQVS